MNMDLAHRCGVCRCYLDGEDLFCANCGTENPMVDDSAIPLENIASHYSFDCKSCGASMSYDASAQALRCPFCGSTQMEKREASRSIRPLGILRFTVARPQADSIFRNWLAKGFWRPTDAARASTIGEIAAVYVPFWVFEGVTDTRWAADSSPAPAGSRGQWYPVTGKNAATYPGILIGGSRILTPTETESMAPFHFEASVAPEDVDLANVIVEEFRVPRKLARPLAQGAIEQLEQQACARHVPNRARNLRINMRLSSMRGDPMLLPVWILAYRYKQHVRRVLINGQTGKISGSAPFSYGKLTVVLLIAAALVAAIVVLAILANA